MIPNAARARFLAIIRMCARCTQWMALDCCRRGREFSFCAAADLLAVHWAAVLAGQTAKPRAPMTDCCYSPTDFARVKQVRGRADYLIDIFDDRLQLRQHFRSILRKISVCGDGFYLPLSFNVFLLRWRLCYALARYSIFLRRWPVSGKAASRKHLSVM